MVSYKGLNTDSESALAKKMPGLEKVKERREKENTQK